MKFSIFAALFTFFSLASTSLVSEHPPQVAPESELVDEVLLKEIPMVMIDDSFGSPFLVGSIDWRIKNASDLLQKLKDCIEALNKNPEDKQTLVNTLEDLYKRVNPFIIGSSTANAVNSIELHNYDYRGLAQALIYEEVTIRREYVDYLKAAQDKPNVSFFYSLVQEFEPRLEALKQAKQVVNGSELSTSFILTIDLVMIGSFVVLLVTAVHVLKRKRHTASTPQVADFLAEKPIKN